MGQLTKDQVLRLAAVLKERQRRLRSEIREGLMRSVNERYKDMAGVVSDSGDEAVADTLADLGIAEIDRDVQELREVESALARVGTAEFGICADCGEAIAFERMEAQPSAARCLTCQGRHERGYAHPKASTL
jgi:RNA polymerase-binding protein DksA